jgi:hypothetical protein
MHKENTFIKTVLLVIPLLLAVSFGSASYAQKPIVTDEFDRFLVTRTTKIGEVLGKIELVFLNEKKTTWSLVPPVPGGDRRKYLKEGQLDATKIVEIDADTGELSLKAQPPENPAHYYAEVRATNSDGFMEQVLIIIALPETPKRENALDIFTQRREALSMDLFATNTLDPEKIEYAVKVADALLSKDRRGSGKITEYLKKNKATMIIFKDFEERNTAISYSMHSRNLGMRPKTLTGEGIIPDYFRLGGPANLRRDESVEEIAHLIHGGGIIEAYPGVQKRLEEATKVAVERKFFRPQDGLPARIFHYEYLILGLQIHFGGFGRRSFNGLAMTPENFKEIDHELYDIISFLFPTREEFFKEMGWEADLK